MKVFNRQTITKDTVIFREGDPASCAYLLVSGKVEIVTKRDGEIILLNTIQPNQLFGELALIDGAPRSATAVATEDCEVTVVSAEDMNRHLDGLDNFMKYWLSYLTDRVRDLSKRVDK